MIVATFNIQNKMNENEEEKIQKLFQIIEREKIDIIGMQEVAPKYFKLLQTNQNYFLNGKPRLGKNILTKISYFQAYNEAVPILTRTKPMMKKTYRLPWIPPISLMKDAFFHHKSVTPRIFTAIQIEENNQKITIINTHLEKGIERLKEKQLKKILTYIKGITTPIILMGDFNLKRNSKIFEKFSKELEVMGIKWVSTKEKTLKSNHTDNLAIDHIFVRDFMIVKTEIMDNQISDHYLLKVELK